MIYKVRRERNARFMRSFRSISSQSLPGVSASSTRRKNSFLWRAYPRMSLIHCSVAIERVVGFGCCLSDISVFIVPSSRCDIYVKNGGAEWIEGRRYPRWRLLINAQDLNEEHTGGSGMGRKGHHRNAHLASDCHITYTSVHSVPSLVVVVNNSGQGHLQ